MTFLKRFYLIGLLALTVLALVACTKKVEREKDEVVTATGQDLVLEAAPKLEHKEFNEKNGYRFVGWFKTKRGVYWLEKEPVTFPYTLKRGESLHTYWEPIDSKKVQYTAGETYVTSVTSSAVIVLNPFTYQWNHEDGFMSDMSTPYYGTVIDWDKAIENGLAKFPGDFSKFKEPGAPTALINQLKYKYELIGGVHFPKDSTGDEHLLDGKFDFENANSFKDTKWTFEIRRDLKFENGTPVTAKTYEYALQQYLSPEQANSRANSFYKTEKNKNGAPIKNAYEYFQGKVKWEEVGFKIKGDYSFEIETFELINQLAILGIVNNIKLVEPTIYEKSLNREKKSTYGTPKTPYVSYGAYIMKSWDENQKIVFNKNYDYVGKHEINIKSREIQIVDSIDTSMTLFKQGKLSHVGLNKQYYAEFAENPNVRSSWEGYPHSIWFNLKESTVATNKKRTPIIFEQEFRQAVFFALDRKYYSTNEYAPNKPSMLGIPVDTTEYKLDDRYFSDSEEAKQLFNKLGINVETYGYDVEKAKQLFEIAYNNYKTKTGQEKATIYLLASTDKFEESLNKFIKDKLEEAFGKERFEVVIDKKEQEALKQANEQLDFDFKVSNIGFGLSTGASQQIMMLPILAGDFAPPSLGLSNGYDDSNVLLETDPLYEKYNKRPKYFAEEFEISLPKAYELLKNANEQAPFTDEDPRKEFFEMFGKVSGKPEILKATYLDFMLAYINAYDYVYDAPVTEPFPGALDEVRRISVAMLEKSMVYTPIVPLSSRSSAVLYSENVTIEWPVYSSIYGWGGSEYRYLNSDPDFK